MKYLLIRFLLVIALSGFTILQGQATKSIVSQHLHKVSGSDCVVRIPGDFAMSAAHTDEFVQKEKGTVLKFAHLQDIPASRFCDSMTTRYFESQGLQEVTETTVGEITNYKGKFTLDRIPYIRSFHVIPYQGGTVLCIGNYPEVLSEELDIHFLNMYKKGEDE